MSPSIRMALLLCALLCAGLLASTQARIHVHLVPHTHNDVGWLKTVDQYYMGANKTYDPHSAVQYILSTVIPALVANPARRFIYVEQGFFQRWWRQQSDAMQETVQGLVSSGQLEFINGGWCMHDEAAPHYIDMIDQTTLGHRYLLAQFNVTPSIGWQIDPFGHSLTQAALLSYDVGFDAVFLGRIDYQDHLQRTATSNLEFVWRGSPSRTDPANQVFAQATPTGGYNAPRGLCFDQTCADEFVQDDPSLTDYNVEQRVNDFVAAAWEQGNHSNCNADDAATCNIMFMMGEDFQYENANVPFTNLDKIIEYVNRDGRVTTQYSLPSTYIHAKHAENLTWTTKTDDFFPYASTAHSMWSGYFTSRPALKRMIRTSSAFLLTARQLEVFTALPTSDGTSVLEEAVAVTQHHDAVAGTSKQHVAYDYAQRLAKGLNLADATVNTALAALVGGGDVAFESCPLLNVSLCATQGALPRVLVLYNALLRSRTELVRLPVNASAGLVVLDSTNATLYSSVLPTFTTSAAVQGGAPHTLSFYATVPALGFSTFFLTAAPEQKVEEQSSTADAFTLSNDVWSIGFDSATGLITNLTDLRTNTTRPLHQSFYYYIAGRRDSQNAGAYVLLPNTSIPTPISPSANLTLLSTGIAREARQVFSGWVYQTIRLEGDVIAFEWTIGELPNGTVGHEVVTRYTADIASASRWYSDSNAREMIERTRDYRATWNYTVNEPVAGNYVPVNAACGLNDTRTALFVLVDRAQGCTSLEDGQLEFLLHRRLFADDGKGLNEPLNETQGIEVQRRRTIRLGRGLTVTGTHYLVLQPTPVQTATNIVRSLQSRVYLPLHLVSSPMQAASVSAYLASHTATSSFLANALPPQLDLITLQALAPGRALVRFAHAFGRNGIDEGNFSTPVTLNLTTSPFTRATGQWEEVSLTANQKPVTQRAQLQWNIRGEGAAQGKEAAAARAALPAAGGSVLIDAMEVKTFLVDFATPSASHARQPSTGRRAAVAKRS